MLCVQGRGRRRPDAHALPPPPWRAALMVRASQPQGHMQACADCTYVCAWRGARHGGSEAKREAATTHTPHAPSAYWRIAPAGWHWRCALEAGHAGCPHRHTGQSRVRVSHCPGGLSVASPSLFALLDTGVSTLGAHHGRGYNSHVGWTDARRRARPTSVPFFRLWTRVGTYIGIPTYTIYESYIQYTTPMCTPTRYM